MARFLFSWLQMTINFFNGTMGIWKLQVLLHPCPWFMYYGTGLVKTTSSLPPRKRRELWRTSLHFLRWEQVFRGACSRAKLDSPPPHWFTPQVGSWHRFTLQVNLTAPKVEPANCLPLTQGKAWKCGSIEHHNRSVVTFPRRKAHLDFSIVFPYLPEETCFQRAGSSAVEGTWVLLTTERYQPACLYF